MRDRLKWLKERNKRMIPETQTLFSITLFFALSSLLAWSNRRNRTHQLVGTSAVSGSEAGR